jgi:hypothetical protein
MQQVVVRCTKSQERERQVECSSDGLIPSCFQHFIRVNYLAFVQMMNSLCMMKMIRWSVIERSSPEIRF